MEDGDTQPSRGRPKRRNKTGLDEAEVMASPRRPGSALDHEGKSSESSPNAILVSGSSLVSSPTPIPGSVRSHQSLREKFYLLGSSVDKLSLSKLPKHCDILRRFLTILKDSGTSTQSAAQAAAVQDAAKHTASEIKLVWKHHFGLRMTFGKDLEHDKHADEALKLIVMDDKIEAKVLSIFKEWKELEKTSRRKDRCEKDYFKMKVETFQTDKLDMPMNIAKQNAEDILRYNSRITCWKEDYAHLQEQMKREQKSSVLGLDAKQQKKDNAKLAKVAAEENQKMVTENNNNKEVSEPENEVVEDDDNSDTFSFKIKRPEVGKKDIMGAVAVTGDRLGLSVREKTMFAASLCNAVGVSVRDTNISKTTAWRRMQQERLTTAKAVKDNFVKPKHVTVHWDGKILKLQAGVTSDRCCVYISGADGAKVSKLLGIPEIPNGTGSSQEKAVEELLISWELFEEITGLVYDTTASNTGEWRGACALIEQYLRRAILWLACRHHMYELHIKHVVEEVSGDTKEPGVKIFRRLKTNWNKMEIECDNLSKFDWTTADPWLCKRAEEVLIWSLKHLKKKSFPRDDYKELLHLVIVWLGGHVEKFCFKYPGADHHARWMSKALYYMKLMLLLNHIPTVMEVEDEDGEEENKDKNKKKRKKKKKVAGDAMVLTEKEKMEIMKVGEFVGLFYAQAFFKSPLPSSSPRNDLIFMNQMRHYRKFQPEIAEVCLVSIHRHLWYLCPQLVVFALADTGTPAADLEDLSNNLFKIPRPAEIPSGKPKFPSIIWPEESDSLPKLSSFLTSDSWLLFNLLGLSKSQEWMQLPSHMWEKFEDYRAFKEYVDNVKVVNDLAERGIKLISDFIHMTKDEEQVQALLQCVEHHRDLFPNYNKKTLEKVNC